MATLVLTAVGSVFGPIGSAIGALLGQSIDSQIFKPKGREGPRLQDLRVQTSSYGSFIPKLFGGMRVAGTVIWATDLIEHRSRKGGGKGQPSTTMYSYTASFAVLLSARPIRSVSRIWADGNLLRGAAGDWKSETGFRLHLGDEDQDEDPLIASFEALDRTPAYRGCAYAVFENTALGPFGNRIPSLTFEVAADVAPVPIGTMLEELSAGAVIGGDGAALRGFAATGSSMRAVVDTLAPALPMTFRADEGRLRLNDDVSPAISLQQAELGEARSETFGADAETPGSLTLSYYDPSRDYQAGVQQARRASGHRTERIELPAALDAQDARALAEGALARLARESGGRSVQCGWARLSIAPGMTVSLPGDAGLWRVTARTIDRDGVRLNVRRQRSGSMPNLPADPGRALPAADRVQGATTVHLLDLPSLTDDLAAVPRLLIAAAGASPGWRRAALMVSLDDGRSWDPIGSTAAPATIGVTLSALPLAGEALVDEVNVLDVALLHDEKTLADADTTRLFAGANLALVGDELIQFRSAEPLGGSNWRLTGLVRGRRGTGWAAATHMSGERFVLLEAETLLAYDPPLSAAGGMVRLLASGMGDPTPAEASASNVGEALRPLAPVHLSALREEDGGLAVRWLRRSRAGGAWIDGSDAPLGENSERYRLTIAPAGGAARTYELDQPSFAYSASAVAADLAIGPEVALSVVQVGTYGVSRPASLIHSL